MMKLVQKLFPRIGMLILLPLLAFSVLMLSAQDEEQTAEPSPTEHVTEVATDSPVPTDIPTESPTLEPVVTEAPIEAPAETEASETEVPVTEVVTEAPETVVPAEPPFTMLMREMFDNGDVSPWNIGAGWSLVASGSGQAFQSSGTEALELNKGEFYNVAVQASFLSDTATAVLSIRNSAAGNYSLSLSPDGTVGLYRAGSLVASGLAAASTSGQWRILRISAVDAVVRAAIDNTEVLVYEDGAALPPGTVRISATFGIPEAANILLVDDFFLSVLVDEAANYPAPTAYAPPLTEAAPVTEAPVTEAAPTEVTPVASGETKDYSPFPPPTAEQLAQSQVMSTLGNDNWYGLVVPSFPYIVSDNTIGDTLEVGEPASSCGIGMSNTVWFKLEDVAAGNYRFSSTGSDFDTILAVYTGSSVGALTQVACNDDISAVDLDSQVTLNLSAGLDYFIQVGGFNGRYGNYSLTVQLLGLAAPGVPTLDSPANATRTNNTTPLLDWNSALNAYQYELQWATNATFTANLQKAFIVDPVTDYTLPTLPNSAGTTYYWRVRAINGSGVASAFSTTRTFIIDTTALPAATLSSPANAVVSTSSTPMFRWTAVTGAQAYFIDIDNDSDFSSYEQSYQLGATSFTITIPLPQGSYYWRVRVQDAAGNISISASRTITIKILTSPANNFVFINSSQPYGLVLQWAAVAGASSYRVQIALDTDFSILVLNEDVGNILTYAVALDYGKYHWQVIPTGFEQTTAVYSSFTISPDPIAAPGLLNPGNGLRVNASLTFNWADVGASAYELQWATNATFTANFHSEIVNGTSFGPTLPNSPGQLYYWRVRSINNLFVAGAYSATRTFTLDTVAPAAPTLNAPANNAVTTDSTPTLSWSAVTGAVSYHLEADIDEGFGSPDIDITGAGTSYTPATSLPQGLYFWRVTSVDAAGNQTVSVTRSFTLKILTAPANNTVIFSGGNAVVTFQWAAVAGATSYTLQVDDDPDFSADLVLEVPGLTGTSRTETIVLQGIYYWQVVPFGFEQAQEVENVLTVSSPTLAAPGIISPASGIRTSDTSPGIQWTLVPGAVKYEIQWATNSSFTANVGSDQVSDPTDNFILPDLPGTPGTVYYWRVRSLNAYDVGGPYTAARSFTLDTVAPDVPAQLAPADNLVTTNSRPGLSWTAETGAAGYVLDLADNTNFINPILNGLFVTGTSYTPPSAMAQGTYYWRVRSIDSVENLSALSPVRSFTIKILSSPANNAVITTSSGTANVVLRWAAVSGATAYTVEIDDNDTFSSPDSVPLGNVLTYTAPALTTGVYYWKVTPNLPATAVLVYSSFTVSPGALVATNVFSPPNGTYTNDTTPDVSWGSVTNAFQYEIQWATNTSFTANMGSAIVSAPTSSLTLPTLPDTAGTVYYWRLRVINSLGVAGPYSPYWNFRLDTVAPNVPALVAPANGSTTMVNPVQFRWNAATGAFRYELRYGTNNPPEILVTNLATTSYTSPSPLLLSNYYWQVRAVDQAGNASAWSSLREVKINSGTTSAPIPNHFTTLTPTLNWTPISWTSGGGYYQLEIDNNNNFGSPGYVNYNISSASPSVTTSSLSEGTWYWRVRACTPANVCGAWSTTGIFTIEQ